VDNAERIALMLDMASFDALERGAAIVFAKITPGALMALRSRMGRLKLRGIEVVPVSALAAPPPPSVAP
jgi:polysaccharide deacetylase 2 family uncharacterized protein YibQ